MFQSTSLDCYNSIAVFRTLPIHLWSGLSRSLVSSISSCIIIFDNLSSARHTCPASLVLLINCTKLSLLYSTFIYCIYITMYTLKYTNITKYNYVLRFFSNLRSYPQKYNHNDTNYVTQRVTI